MSVKGMGKGRQSVEKHGSVSPPESNTDPAEKVIGCIVQNVIVSA